jgi:hypothetical protein
MRKWVLWGHQFSDYKEMFDLPAEMNQQKILEFACGPTTVNQELTQQGIDIHSCDPWFESNVDEMRTHFDSHLQHQVQRMQAHPDAFNLKQYGGLEFFVEHRLNGFNQFFKDFPQGLVQKRYIGLSNQKLPFENHRFDLALCANFLFADLPDQDLDFHVYWISEMLRVAHDVRIYPLTNKYGQPSELLGPVLLALQQLGIQVSVQDVPFRVVPESMAMLKLHSGKCDLA